MILPLSNAPQFTVLALPVLHFQYGAGPGVRDVTFQLALSGESWELETVLAAFRETA